MLRVLAAATAVTSVLAASSASATGPRAALSAPPRPLNAGAVWNATLTVRPTPARPPAVVARGAGRLVTVAARRASPGRFRVRLVFPVAGRWSLSTRVGRTRLALRTVTVIEAPPPTSPLPGADAFRVCGGGRIPYQQYAAAFGAGSVWVACSALQRVERVDPVTGRVVARISLPSVRPWSIAADDTAVWTMGLPDTAASRIDPATNRLGASVRFDGSAPYLWAAAGALWIGDDAGRAIIRVDPATNRVVARYPVGDGPAGFVTDGRSAWVLNHREGSLDRIDVASGTVTRLANGLGADNAAAERIALAGGSLWITGRGLDLLRVDPATGAVLARTEIGPAGIDVVTVGGSVWVAAYDAQAEPRGDPVLGALRRVDPSTGAVVETRTPTSPTFANGLIVGGGHLWVFDAVHGLLLRL